MVYQVYRVYETLIKVKNEDIMIALKQEKVYQEIKKNILTGALKNNSRITERALAEELSVTRVPVRESLVKLEQDGLIKKIPSVGYIVDNYSPEELKEAMLMRFTVECQAVSLAAQFASMEDIIRIKVANEAMKNAAIEGDIDTVIEQDREFHSLIVKASGNKVLNKIYSIVSISTFYTKESYLLSKTGALGTYENHNRVIEAIENKDSDKAFRFIAGHTPGNKYFQDKFKSDIVQKSLNREY